LVLESRRVIYRINISFNKTYPIKSNLLLPAVPRAYWHDNNVKQINHRFIWPALILEGENDGKIRVMNKKSMAKEPEQVNKSAKCQSSKQRTSCCHAV